MRDLRFAFRILFRAPLFTGVAVLSLALGIGPNVAIFSLFEQYLLRPLPVDSPEQLVNLSSPGPQDGSQSCNRAGDCDEVFSYPMFRDLEAVPAAFRGIAAHREFDANIAFGDQAISGEAMLVSGSYFPLLGVRPALGRLLGPSDDEGVGGNSVAVLSYSYWARYLDSDPNVLGETILVDGHPMTIVGVTADGFYGTTFDLRPQVFVPLTMRGILQPGFDGFGDRRNYWLYLFGRVEPGVSLGAASAAINGIYRPIISEVEAPLQQGMNAETLARFRDREVVVSPGSRGQSSIDEDAVSPLMLMFGITAIVLLIACANVANLLLARGANRGAEMAVRLSLGASRFQVVAQLLTEACVLALLGGLASLLLARWTLALVGYLMPAEDMYFLDLELHTSATVFAAVLAIGTALVFGMFPALDSTRSDLATAIRGDAAHVASGTRSAARFRNTLVTAQIGLSMMLLVLAGLFLKSLVNVSQVDLGLETDDVVTFAISPELNSYEPARSLALYQRLEDELAGHPGVVAVTASTVPILAGSENTLNVEVEGFDSGQGSDPYAKFTGIGSDFFRTMGIPLLAGREFRADDRAGAPGVAIVNEAFAEKFGLGRDAVGALMSRGTRPDGALDLQIVGLVANSKYSDVKDEIPPIFYLPYRQDTDEAGRLHFYLRTAADPARLLREIPSIVARIDPTLPVEDLKTLPQQVRENVGDDRVISILSSAFALLATLLATGGLYGVLSYLVARRTREIGVRIALGASGRRVARMVLGQMGRMTILGGIAGIAAALAIARAAGSMLFGLDAIDPVVLVVSVVALGVVTFGAGYLPSRRAASVDPAEALRYE